MNTPLLLERGSFSSATARPGDQLNGFKNGETQLFNSRGVVKWVYFQKKWSVHLTSIFGCKFAALLFDQFIFFTFSALYGYFKKLLKKLFIIIILLYYNV